MPTEIQGFFLKALSDILSQDNSHDKHAAFLKGLYNDRVSGTITQDDVNEVFKGVYQPKFTDMTRLFFLGKLFKAQTQTFDNWLYCQDLKEDVETFKQIEGLAFLCSHPKDAEKPLIDPRITSFAHIRLFKYSPSMRKEIYKSTKDDSDERSKSLKKWSNENSLNGWTWT